MTDPLNKPSPLPQFPYEGVVTPVRRPDARQRFNLSIDTTDWRHRAVEPDVEEDIKSTTTDRSTWQIKLEVQLMLFQAKTILDNTPTTDAKYRTIDDIARQAHARASVLRDTDLTARCCFYLGECEVTRLNRPGEHLMRAREFYTRCTLCTEELAVEPALARRRLEELDAMFPTSALSVASNIVPWSATSSEELLSARSACPAVRNTADDLRQRAVNLAQRRSYTRVPSFDSTASSSPLSARSMVGTNGGQSVVQPPTPSPVLQMMFGAYAVDFNELDTEPPVVLRSRAKTVSFADELEEGRGSGKEICQRRKLNRTLTTPNDDSVPEFALQAPDETMLKSAKE